MGQRVVSNTGGVYYLESEIESPKEYLRLDIKSLKVS